MDSLSQRALDTLHTETMFYDDTLLYMLQTIVGNDGQVIDPIILSLLVDARGKNEKINVSALQRRFQEAVERDLPIILPLNHNKHWSLLVTRPSWSQWYACDSVRNFHRRRAVDVLATLDRLHIHPVKGTRIYFYDDMPEQPFSYECGHFLLFYAFVFIRILTVSRDQGKSEAALEAELPLVCDRNRAGFEARLTRLAAGANH
jgi:hypothetical protein